MSSMTRTDAMRRVFGALFRYSQDQSNALYRDENGSLPIVVAFPNENVSEVLARVSNIGDGANVAIAYAKYFSMIPLGPARDSDSDLVINQDLSMGMLELKLTQNPGKRLRLVMRDTEAAVELGGLELQYA